MTIESAQGSPSGGGWYDSGVTANAVLSDGTVSGGTGIQYVFIDWSGDASGTDLTSDDIVMNYAKTATANWKTQYKVSFATNPGGGGTVTPSVETWIDQGANPISISASASSGYSFSSWSATTGINIANAQSSGTTATVTAAGTITANFTTTIPEFTPNLLLPVFMAITLLLVIGYKRKTTRHQTIT